MRQIGDAVGQLLLLVGLPEEARVVEAGAQHALIAAADEALGIGVDVHHRDELRRELAVGVFHREILLVVAHHRDQDFFGQFEELRVEAAGDRGGIFGEVDQRFEQRVVGLDADADQLVADLLAALLGREDHEVVAQPLLVIGDGDRDLARAQPAMPAGQRARAHARQFERDDLVAQQRHDPADRPDEARAALAGPVHRLRESRSARMMPGSASARMSLRGAALRPSSTKL